MKFSVSILFFVAISFSASSQVNYEQNALDYLVSNLDSFRYFDGDKAYSLSGAKNIYADTLTNGHSLVNFSNLNTSCKREFIHISESLKKAHPYPRQHIKIKEKARKISLPLRITFLKSVHHFEKNTKFPDVFIIIRNVIPIENQYIVRIDIRIQADWISCETYLKLNKNGNVVDHIQKIGIQ